MKPFSVSDSFYLSQETLVKNSELAWIFLVWESKAIFPILTKDWGIELANEEKFYSTDMV